MEHLRPKCTACPLGVMHMPSETDAQLFAGTVVCSAVSSSGGMVLRSGRSLAQRTSSLQPLREEPISDDSDDSDDERGVSFNSAITDAPRPGRRGVPVQKLSPMHQQDHSRSQRHRAKVMKTEDANLPADDDLKALPLMRSGCSDLLGSMSLPV